MKNILQLINPLYRLHKEDYLESNGVDVGVDTNSKPSLTKRIIDPIGKTMGKYARTIAGGVTTAITVTYLGRFLETTGERDATIFYATAAPFLGTMIFLTYLKESGRFERHFPRVNKFLDKFYNPHF